MSKLGILACLTAFALSTSVAVANEGGVECALTMNGQNVVKEGKSVSTATPEACAKLQGLIDSGKFQEIAPDVAANLNLPVKGK